MRSALNLAIALLLTAVSFVGGIAWLLSRLVTWRKRAFVLAYCGLSLALTAFAQTGQAPRVPVAMASTETPLKVPRFYRYLNRDFVTPELQSVANDLAAHLHTEFPGTVTVALDGGFPFFDGLPLLPHLSHDDGEKLDLGFWWTDSAGTYLPGRMKSPIGFWGYELGRSDCARSWKDLRWDFAWLQPHLPDYQLDEDRTRAALLWLARDPRVSRILIEPHITQRLGIDHPKIRFQGCRAARHDDHIHIQL